MEATCWEESPSRGLQRSQREEPLQLSADLGRVPGRCSDILKDEDRMEDTGRKPKKMADEESERMGRREEQNDGSVGGLWKGWGGCLQTRLPCLLHPPHLPASFLSQARS